MYLACSDHTRSPTLQTLPPAILAVAGLASGRHNLFALGHAVRMVPDGFAAPDISEFPGSWPRSRHPSVFSKAFSLWTSQERHGQGAVPVHVDFGSAGDLCALRVNGQSADIVRLYVQDILNAGGRRSPPVDTLEGVVRPGEGRIGGVVRLPSHLGRRAAWLFPSRRSRAAPPFPQASSDRAGRVHAPESVQRGPGNPVPSVSRRRQHGRRQHRLGEQGAPRHVRRRGHGDPVERSARRSLASGLQAASRQVFIR